MKMLDFLPFAGMLAGMLWVSTVYCQCRKRLLSAYRDEGVSPGPSSFSVSNGGAWSIFDPTPEDNPRIIEVKACLIQDYRRKLRYFPITIPGLILLLMLLRSHLSK